MTWKELKVLVDGLGDVDDYFVEVVGINSGGCGYVLSIDKSEGSTPVGAYNEVLFFIDV